LIDVENLYKYLKKYIPSCFENPQLTDSFVKEIADKQQLPLEDAERYLVLLTHPININFVEVERHDNGFYKLWLKNVVKKIFATLGEKDSALAEMYYCSSLTYSEIAEKLDVSRERIRQKFIKIDQKVKKEGSRYFDIDPRITEFNF
jgi:RNA polymerase sigma factor (sigma-70 family)